MSSPASSSESWRARFVGRAPELRTLDRRFAEIAPALVAEGQPPSGDIPVPCPRPAIVVLRGESGLGKSRIVQEFYRRIACSTEEAELPLDPDDYWPDAFGDPDASGKLVNPVIPTDQTRGKVPPFLWWGVQWPEPAPGQPPTRAAFLDGGYLDCLEAHFEGVRQRFSRAMSLARKAGGLAVRNISFGMIDGDLVLDAADGLGRIGERLEAAKRLFVGHDHATRVHERGRDRLRDLQSRLRTILRPPGVGSLHDASTPLILWLDDAQWMTADEVEMLHQLWEDAISSQLPLLIIATHWETPWLVEQDRAMPLDAEGRSAPDSFATFARTVAEDRLTIHDITADLDFSGPLAAAMPGITDEQATLILTKAHGHPLLFRLIVDHYLHRPRSFDGRDPTGPLSQRALRDLESIAVEAALNTFARRKIRDLDDTVREVLGWSSVQGVRFLRQVTAEIARLELDSDEPVSAALDTAVDPEAIIQIAGSANQRAFRQNIFREIMLSDLGADRVHIEACVRTVTLEWLEAGNLESRLDGAELDDFLLLATSHLRPATSMVDASSAEHHGWLEAARLRIERALATGQTTLAATIAREIRDSIAPLSDADWTLLAPPSAAPSVEALQRGGTAEEVRGFVDECESRLARLDSSALGTRAHALAIARLWRATGHTHRLAGSPRRQLQCFEAAERSLSALPVGDDRDILHAIARARHYQTAAMQELEGDTQAVPVYREIVDLWRRILEVDPNDVASLDGLGGTLNNLSNCEDDGLLAAQASKDAIEVKTRALELGGETLSRLVLVMNAHGTHSLRLESIGERTSAAEALSRAIAIADRLLVEAADDAHAVDAALHWLCQGMWNADHQFDFRRAGELAEQIVEGGMRLVERAGPTLKSVDFVLRAAEQLGSTGRRRADASLERRSLEITDRAERSLFEISRPTSGLTSYTARVILERAQAGRPLPDGVFERCWDRLIEQLASEPGIESRLELLDAADALIAMNEDPAIARRLASVVVPILDSTEQTMVSGDGVATLDQTRRLLEFRRRLAAQLEDLEMLALVVPRLVDVLERLVFHTEDAERLRYLRERLAFVLQGHADDLPDPEAALTRSLDIREALALADDAPASSLPTSQLAVLSRALDEFLDLLPEDARGDRRLDARLRVIEVDLELLSRPGDRDSMPTWLCRHGSNLVVDYWSGDQPEGVRARVEETAAALLKALRPFEDASEDSRLRPVDLLDLEARLLFAGFEDAVRNDATDSPRTRVPDRILTGLAAAPSGATRHDLLFLTELLLDSEETTLPHAEWRRRLDPEFERQRREEATDTSTWSDESTASLLDLNGLRSAILAHLGDDEGAITALLARRRILEWRVSELDDPAAREELAGEIDGETPEPG